MYKYGPRTSETFSTQEENAHEEMDFRAIKTSVPGADAEDVSDV